MPTYLSKRSSENGGFIGQSSLLSNQAGVITGYTSPTYVGNLLFTNSDTRTHTLSLSTITGITNGDLVFVLCSVASSTTFPGTYTVSDKTWVPVVNTGVQSIGALYSLMITGYSRYSTRNNSLTFVHADGTYASNFTYEVYVWRNASAVYYPFGFSVNSSSTSATPSIDPAVSLPTLLPNSVLLTTASGTLFGQINTGWTTFPSGFTSLPTNCAYYTSPSTSNIIGAAYSVIPSAGSTLNPSAFSKEISTTFSLISANFIIESKPIVSTTLKGNSGTWALSDTSLYQKSKYSSSVVYSTPGVYSWVCPENVYSVCAVAVGAGGAGGSGYRLSVSGGGGGGLGWKNHIPVIPGNTYEVIVGAAIPRTATGGTVPTIPFSSGSSSFEDEVIGFGGTGPSTLFVVSAYGGPYIGQGGGSGGNGGATSGTNYSSGAGGAGGYSGSGGNGGGTGSSGSAGTGGGGGGGASSSYYEGSGGSGGAVGLFGEGSSGAGGVGGGTAGSPGSNGTVSTSAVGGSYGAGASSHINYNSSTYPVSVGGGGGVRLVWGYDRYFPLNKVSYT